MLNKIPQGLKRDSIISELDKKIKRTSLEKLRRKSLETLLGRRVKTYKLSSEDYYSNYSTLMWVKGQPVVCGVLVTSDQYRLMRVGECFILESEDKSRMYGLLEKELVAYGEDEKINQAVFLVSLVVIGDVVDE